RHRAGANRTGELRVSARRETVAAAEGTPFRSAMARGRPPRANRPRATHAPYADSAGVRRTALVIDFPYLSFLISPLFRLRSAVGEHCVYEDSNRPHKKAPQNYLEIRPAQ